LSFGSAFSFNSRSPPSGNVFFRSIVVWHYQLQDNQMIWYISYYKAEKSSVTDPCHSSKDNVSTISHTFLSDVIVNIELLSILTFISTWFEFILILTSFLHIYFNWVLHKLKTILLLCLSELKVIHYSKFLRFSYLRKILTIPISRQFFFFVFE
jgi:hypothetical protein